MHDMPAFSARPESSARRRSSTTARLTSLPLAVVLWVLSICGVALHGQAFVEGERRRREAFATEGQEAFATPGLPWEWVIGATALLVVAALLWAVLTAWSSVGTVVVGLASIAAGMAVASTTVLVQLYEWILALDESAWQLVPFVAKPATLTLLGAMLLAVGLGAALIRRRR